MLPVRTPDWRLSLLGAAALLAVSACSGCSMLGAIAYEHPIGLIALVVAIVAAIGFLASRSERR